MTVPVRQNNTLALVSLIAGILGWTVLPLLGSLIAIITGHMARTEIRQNSAMDGDVLAIVGLVLGWSVVMVTFMCVMAFMLFFGGLAWIGMH